MYEYRTLEDEILSNIVACANESFSDYEIPLQLEENDLKYRWLEANVRFDLSCGVYVDNKLVGIVINAADYLDEKLVAFDLMTGIIPEHQGKKLLNNMLEFSKISFKKAGVKTYYLEVLQSNERAIHVYERLGFSISNEFNCFMGEIDNKIDYNRVTKEPLNHMHIIDVIRFNLSSNSFENSYETVERNITDHMIVYLSQNSLISSFVIFNKHTNKIKQLYCKNEIEFKQLFCSIKESYGSMRLNNINASNIELIQYLKNNGFEHVVDQYQMIMKV